MTIVKVKNYIKYGSKGVISELLCKMCGSVIAARVDMYVRTKTDSAGNEIQVVREKFERFRNYHEVKIAFSDGSYHITHGCVKCLSRELSPEQLTELAEADISLMGLKLPRKRTAVKVAAQLKDDRGLA